MNILVIGSRGFIGSNCQSIFQNQGHQVFGCDIIDSSSDQNYFQIDFENPSYDEIFYTVKPEYCVNCSGAASVPESFDNPYRDFALNTDNVLKMLESIKQFAPDCKFINISSAAVYGNPSSNPISESHPLNPLSPYGYHKMMADQMCAEYRQHYDLKTSVLRVFSAYGPGLKKQLFWDVYQKSQSQSEITLYGTGRESRDFIFVEDLVRVIEIVFKCSSFEGEYYNVGNGKECFIDDSVNVLLNLLGWKGKLKFSRNSRKGDPSNWKADIMKISEMGYSPQFSLLEGLKKYVEWLGDCR